MSFSVLISIYNKENPIFLKDSLNSLLDQSHKPAEIILVKDGPITDELEEELKTFHLQFGPTFKVIALPENGGLGKALSIGLQHCSYDIVARMDGDDICLPTRFEIQYNYLKEKSDVSLVGCLLEEFNERPKDLGRVKTVPISYKDILKYAKLRNPVNHPTVMFRKSVILSVNSYEDMPYFEDYYLWVKLLNNGYIIENINEVLLYFRVGNNMIGRRHGVGYLIHELKFIKSIRKSGFINHLTFIKLICLRLPLRLMPQKILKTIYGSFLRK